MNSEEDILPMFFAETKSRFNRWVEATISQKFQKFLQIRWENLSLFFQGMDALFFSLQTRRLGEKRRRQYALGYGDSSRISKGSVFARVH